MQPRPVVCVHRFWFWHPPCFLVRSYYPLATPLLLATECQEAQPGWRPLPRPGSALAACPPSRRRPARARSCRDENQGTSSLSLGQSPPVRPTTQLRPDAPGVVIRGCPSRQVRRLYDICNVLTPLKMIEKVRLGQSSKPAFRWYCSKAKRVALFAAALTTYGSR